MLKGKESINWIIHVQSVNDTSVTHVLFYVQVHVCAGTHTHVLFYVQVRIGMHTHTHTFYRYVPAVLHDTCQPM